MTRLLTYPQAAARLGVAVRTMKDWKARGLLPYVQLPGRAVRFDERDLDVWVARRTRCRRCM